MSKTELHPWQKEAMARIARLGKNGKVIIQVEPRRGMAAWPPHVWATVGAVGAVGVKSAPAPRIINTAVFYDEYAPRKRPPPPLKPWRKTLRMKMLTTTYNKYIKDLKT